VGRYRLDANQDPDSTCHFDGDTDPDPDPNPCFTHLFEIINLVFNLAHSGASLTLHCFMVTFQLHSMIAVLTQCFDRTCFGKKV
jgi:hypothetical protein